MIRYRPMTTRMKLTVTTGLLAFCLAAAALAQEAPQIGTEGPSLSAPAPMQAPTTPEPAESALDTPTAEPTAPEIEMTPSETAPAAPTGARPDTAFADAEAAAERALEFLREGGPAIWAIAALSVATAALILWKIWHLALMGAWARGKAGRAVAAFGRGDRQAALALVEGRRGIRSKVLSTTLASLQDVSEDTAREETARVAKRHLASARDGLGALELIATIAPLLGLLGTVLGMIAAFQALQAAGSRADPALLAGGIWEALLTTAAGMAVAIPASAALTWFEAVVDRMRRDIEDNATRVFVAARTPSLRLAAE